MCNEAARRIALDQLRVDWSQLKIPLRFPEGLPNFQPTDSIRITDPAPILRAAVDAPGEVEMVSRRWSWPAPSGKPVYNYRSDGREFRNGSAKGVAQGRCLIPIDGFYEFTEADAPLPPAGGVGGGPADTEGEGASLALGAHPSIPSRQREGRKQKAKWEFAMRGLAWFCVAGLWRGGITFKDGTQGDAWTMLTCPPGPDIAPYHDRQIVLLRPEDYDRWLDGSTPAADLCRPLPAGSLDVRQVR